MFLSSKYLNIIYSTQSWFGKYKFFKTGSSNKFGRWRLQSCANVTSLPQTKHILVSTLIEILI